MATEREYPLVPFPAGPVRGADRDALLGLVERFEPLDFEAARQAKLWLQTNLNSEALPLPTYFVFSDEEGEEDGAQLFGFMVLNTIEVRIANEDIPVMMVRKRISDPYAPKHQATKLVWVARSTDSPAGFGSEMFDYALLVAEDDGSCALMVDAWDEETAEKLWIKHYELRSPRDGADDWSCLWHAVGKANQDFN